MSNSWRQPAYLHKRSAVMERDCVDESTVKVPREIMPDCVLSPVGCRTVLSLVGCRTVCCHLCESCIQILSASHILEVKVSYLFLHFAASFIFCYYEPDVWKMEHVVFICLSDRAAVRH